MGDVMPIGKYPTFSACVTDQMKIHSGEKGFKIENARSICGAIEKRTKNEQLSEVYHSGACGIENYEEVGLNE